jgi:hypothetical protein
MSEKILKKLTFTYNIKGEEIKPDSIFVGYYTNLSIDDEKFNKFYYTLSDEQKMLFLKLWN